MKVMFYRILSGFLGLAAISISIVEGVVGTYTINQFIGLLITLSSGLVFVAFSFGGYPLLNRMFKDKFFSKHWRTILTSNE